MTAVVRKAELDANDVELGLMRRRHLRQVLKIEARVYPRPWSAALFLQEIARKSDRYYIVARFGNDVVGYGGLMVTSTEGHITTIAVDPEAQRRHIGMRLMLAMIEESINRGCLSVSLEVRKANHGAQRMYERFGFRPIGLRRGYYVETGEDAIVMWADDVSTEEYKDKLEELRKAAASLPRA